MKPTTKKPKPPPEPPRALVNLLKSDKAVQSYFLSLQENLKYDTQKWKDRARTYHSRVKELESEVTELKQKHKGKQKNGPSTATATGGGGGKKRARKNANLNGKTNHNTNSTTQTTTATTALRSAPASKEPASSTPVRGVPIEDDMIEFESSSSSSDDDGDDDSSHNREGGGSKEIKIARRRKTADASRSKMGKKRRLEHTKLPDRAVTGMTIPPFQTPVHDLKFAMEKLIYAENLLKELGINLVWEVQEEASHTSEGEDDEDNIHIDPITVRSRVSDQDLASQIMKTIKLLSKVHTADNSYFPFTGTSLTPCYIPNSDIKGPQHPAVQGIANLIEALSILDTFSASLPEIEKHGDLSAPESLLVGMKDRESFVKDLGDSLVGEIVDFWPVHDRSTRLLTASLFFNENDVHAADQLLDKSESNETLTSKSFSRLAALAERCMTAQLATGILLCRNDFESASSVVINYVASSVPALDQEDYPKLPPVLSFCVIEAMTNALTAREGKNTWLSVKLGSSPGVASVLSLAFHLTASIYKQRLTSLDSRISDVSKVEMAAFCRLLQQEGSWILKNPPGEQAVENNPLTASRESIDNFLARRAGQKQIQEPLYLSLVLNGGEAMTVHVFKNSLDLLRNDGDKAGVQKAIELLLSSCASFRQLNIRRIDSYRQSTGTFSYSESDSVTISISEVLNLLSSGLFREKKMNAWAERVAANSLRCSLLLSDGENALKILASIIRQHTNGTQAFGDVQRVIDHTVVRVINLARRKDRMVAFMAQAMQEKLLVIKSVPTTFERESEKGNDDDEQNFWYHWIGDFAFDGKEAEDLIEERMEHIIGPRGLDSLVASKWRPNDLKPFDKEAPDSEDLVHVSPSEKACALSHIASWMGSMRTLQHQAISLNSNYVEQPSDGRPNKTPSIFRSPTELCRRVCISGYASGPALFHENESSPPAPVCVILEDDAILVDRFADRLKLLLRELPRDFHFCSIGYSRPKTAPVLPYSTHVGIPTSIWYLTGYIISLSGAEYLCSKLPVRGPVDSWIGLNMFSNWDNVYGQTIGVGVHPGGVGARRGDSGVTNSSNALPPRKVLCQLLKFRAFAAMVPLCSQKVGSSGGGAGSGDVGPGTGRSWRQRDTDIEYSGNKIQAV